MHLTEANVLISVVDVVNLTDHNVPHSEITWSRVSMTSDRWICVRHSKIDSTKTFRWIVLDQENDYKHISYSGSTVADSVLMHPSEPIIAFKAFKTFQVFNLDTKSLLCETSHGEKVLFWTWLNSDVIGIITETAICHWFVWKEETSPKKVLNNHRRLKSTQIVSYKADHAMRWLAITGLFEEGNGISGIILVHSVSENLTQCISAHAVCFAEYHFQDNPYPSNVFCVASRDTRSHGNIHVIELHPYRKGNLAPKNTCDRIHVDFLDSFGKYDFPTTIQVSSRYGVLFMITKYSVLYICDMETAAPLICSGISNDIIITATLNTKTQGILGISKDGMVIFVNLQKTKFVYKRKHAVKKNVQASLSEEKKILEVDKMTSDKCQSVHRKTNASQ
ncbi:clathrin heavy chain-like [Gigantopelta aegis]|uniref:clathrin heavy chain-like n=1 Tax=Gigantopelta aegis TaxID=1735272 RepID=UPI001B889C64|nr:clathrin heavy chain-like [Gigantopelta aegis]